MKVYLLVVIDWSKELKAAHVIISLARVLPGRIYAKKTLVEVTQNCVLFPVTEPIWRPVSPLLGNTCNTRKHILRRLTSHG